MIAVRFEPRFEAWRSIARRLASASTPPNEVVWLPDGEQTSLFEDATPPPSGSLTVPRSFFDLAEHVACHRDDGKWSALYRALYRLTHGEPQLLRIETDPDTCMLFAMQKQVAHDMHRMKAFVRFREAGERFIAWYRPDHLIVEQTAPFFRDRFGSMRWSILTPDRSAHWDLERLEFGPGVPPSSAPESDESEDLWRAYYASTFNPARVNPALLRQHVPQRYWPALPESKIFTELIAGANACEFSMRQAQGGTGALVPAQASLPELRQAVHQCRGCELYRHATQPVFGEGPVDAPIVFVGEQPGDKEDVEGRPFVGPAGQLFDTALLEAGLNRAEVYVTNAVKHFRFEERGKKRIHQTATRAQVAACQPWLESELALIRPRLIVCLGATAALSVMGRSVRLLEERGQIRPHRHGAGVMCTVHPSFVLRLPDAARQTEEFKRLVQDLKAANEFTIHSGSANA